MDQTQQLITKIGVRSSKIISGYRSDENLAWFQILVQKSVGLWVGHGLQWFPISTDVMGECFTWLSSRSSSSSDRTRPGRACPSPGLRVPLDLWTA